MGASVSQQEQMLRQRRIQNSWHQSPNQQNPIDYTSDILYIGNKEFDLTIGPEPEIKLDFAESKIPIYTIEYGTLIPSHIQGMVQKKGLVYDKVIGTVFYGTRLDIYDGGLIRKLVKTRPKDVITQYVLSEDDFVHVVNYLDKMTYLHGPEGSRYTPHKEYHFICVKTYSNGKRDFSFPWDCSYSSLESDARKRFWAILGIPFRFCQN